MLQEELFIGVDLHKNKWHTRIQTWDTEKPSMTLGGIEPISEN